jgi:signal transduction histidine kinase
LIHARLRRKSRCSVCGGTNSNEGDEKMISEFAERRCEFRFRLVLPVEYFKLNDTVILSYSLDLSKNGTFISSDCPLNIGSRFSIRLSVPVTYESSKIFRIEGTVAWNKIQPFKSKRNGMGVQFIEPLPEVLLLCALADNIKKLMKESEAKGILEERVTRLESELEETKRLAALGRFVEEILFELSNPIVAISGQLEIIKTKMYRHKRMLEEHEGTDKRVFKKVITEFDGCCTKIDKMLNDYTVISELAHIVGDDREALERKLQRKFTS